MTRISRDHMLMSAAKVFSERSTCNRLHVGAVIAREGRILSSGYNGPPKGFPHCNHSPDDGECFRATHAEANAIVFAARYGVAIEDTSLYTTHSPCIRCAHLIINSGITQVFYNVEYRDPTGVQFLAEAGVDMMFLKGVFR